MCNAVIFLSFWAEVHYNSIYFQGGDYIYFLFYLLFWLHHNSCLFEHNRINIEKFLDVLVAKQQKELILRSSGM